MRSFALCFVISAVANAARLVYHDNHSNDPRWNAVFTAIGSYFVGFELPMILAAYFGRQWFRQILAGRLTGIQIVLVALAAVALSQTVAWALDRIVDTDIGPRNWHHMLHPAEGIWTSYLSAPFIEEMLYQVAIQSNLQRFGAAFAVIASTAAFTAIHLYGGFVEPKIVFVYIFPSLLSFAIIRQTTKSTGAAMLAHSLSNIASSF